MKRKIALSLAVVAAVTTLASCSSRADRASHNLSTAADNFEINRRVVFYNGITGETMLEIDGLCSLGNDDPKGQLSVTCKTGPKEFKKHFLGLSDNVTYFVQQIDGANVSDSRYRVIWRPSTLIPNFDMNSPTADVPPTSAP
jgi:hypothetical protein